MTHAELPAIDRFWLYVKKSDGCWLWTGASPRYGQLRVDGVKVGAHRFSYEVHKGKIPKGFFVCHTCDNPKCVNPDHLFIGTVTDNVQDALKKGLFKPKEYSAKISHLDAARISIMPRRNRDVIGAMFGVSRSTVRDIQIGRTWNM